MGIVDSNIMKGKDETDHQLMQNRYNTAVVYKHILDEFDIGLRPN